MWSFVGPFEEQGRTLECAIMHGQQSTPVLSVNMMNLDITSRLAPLPRLRMSDPPLPTCRAHKTANASATDGLYRLTGPRTGDYIGSCGATPRLDVAKTVETVAERERSNLTDCLFMRPAALAALGVARKHVLPIREVFLQEPAHPCPLGPPLSCYGALRRGSRRARVYLDVNCVPDVSHVVMSWALSLLPHNTTGSSTCSAVSAHGSSGPGYERGLTGAAALPT